jgi:dTDP-4-amino-4,6-dideoxygalactose transaminase
MPPRIPFNRPTLEGRELAYVEEAVRSGHTASSGPFSKRVSALLRDAHGAAEVLLTTSCTDALEMSAMLLDRRPGDTVIVPSFTFVSSALAFAREGFGIVFADIEEETLGIDPEHVASLVDERTRAVVAVHYGGIACDLDGLGSALPEGVDLIEDNAHGLFATRAGRPLGTFGRFSTLSFHETKNIVCGEGGALVVNREDDVARARILLDKGTDRQAFLLGEVDKYSWRDTGSSFGLSDINAAYLWGQMEQREAIIAKRRKVFERYREELAPRAAEFGYSIPRVPEGDVPGYHLFFVLLPDRPTRDRVLAGMARSGVQATFHYVPLDSSEGGRRVAAVQSDCPRTHSVAGRLLRLPYFNGLGDGEIDRVVEAFFGALS